jgi:hypothetical protein
MTREQLHAKVDAHVLGLLMLGTTRFRASLKAALTLGGLDSVEALGKVAQDLPEEARKLVDQIYDLLHRDSQPPPKPAANGNGHGKPALKVGA